MLVFSEEAVGRTWLVGGSPGPPVVPVLRVAVLGGVAVPRAGARLCQGGWLLNSHARRWEPKVLGCSQQHSAPGTLQLQSLSAAAFGPGTEGGSLPHLRPDLGPGTSASAGFGEGCWHADPAAHHPGQEGGKGTPSKGCLFSLELESRDGRGAPHAMESDSFPV